MLKVAPGEIVGENVVRLVNSEAGLKRTMMRAQAVISMMSVTMMVAMGSRSGTTALAITFATWASNATAVEMETPNSYTQGAC